MANASRKSVRAQEGERTARRAVAVSRTSGRRSRKNPRLNQPGLFAGGAFDRPGAEELGKEPAAVGDNCEQAEVEGVIGQPTDEEGEDGGRRHETLGEQEEGAIDYIYGEVPVVVAPYFGLDILIGTDGGGQIYLQHAAHHGDGESAGRNYGSEHRGFRELQFLVVSF